MIADLKPYPESMKSSLPWLMWEDSPGGGAGGGRRPPSTPVSIRPSGRGAPRLALA